jgi:beta-phosphoglucomutase
MQSCHGRLGVIFDLDGVLVDTGWAHRQAWRDLADREGLDISDEFFRRTFGMQNAAILPMLRPGLGPAEIERLSNWKEQRYRDLVRPHVELAPGARPLLDDLKCHGFRLAIGSSAPPENLDVFWDGLVLAETFDARVTKEEITESKPAPQTFLKAAAKLRLPPSCCTVVEDAVAGVQAAHAADMPVVAVTTTRDRKELAEAERIVDSLAELQASDFRELRKVGSERGEV